jgi:hypothetical protein
LIKEVEVFKKLIRFKSKTRIEIYSQRDGLPK